jgi:glycosyltransferase involved in cell wall biosynthesis
MYALRTVQSLLRIDQQNEYHLFLVEDHEQIEAPNLKKLLIPGFDKIVRNRWWENVLLPSYLRKEAVDLFFSPAYALPILPRRQRFIPWFGPLQTKIVVTIHDVIGLVLPETFTWKMKLWLRVFAHNAARAADQIIAISETTKNDFVRYTGCPPEHVSVVYNALDEHFKPLQNEQERQRVRRKYSLPHSFILYVGTIEPRKNLPLLVHAYNLLPKSLRQQYALVIAGGLGWKTGRIVDAIRSNNAEERILLTGYVEDDDLPTLYNLASLFVYPSLYEGFGYPVLEAMACGIPVITSNRSSLPEVAGDAAVLVNPFDARQIAREMERALLDMQWREELQRRGFARAAQFNWKRNAEETLAVLENVMRF